MGLIVTPIFQTESFAFIEHMHRHHKKPVGSIFQIAVSDGKTTHRCKIKEKGKIIEVDILANGVAIVGRPNARRSQDGYTAEVTRLCTDGTPNACSMLYAACWRAARAMGYRKLITYILNTEPGTSLKASGWKLVGERGGGSWSVPSRPRVDKHPLQKKLLFEIQ